VETTSVTLLFVGIEPEVEAFLERSIKEGFTKTVASAASEIDALLENPIEPPPPVICVGPLVTSPSAGELAQFMRMQFADSALLYLTNKLARLDRGEFLKNGYNDVLSIEMDSKLIPEAVRGAMAARSGLVRAFRPVKLVDIEAGATLDFDTMVHLKANNRFVPFSTAGDPLSAERFERLKVHGHTNVHIPHSQMKAFFQYTSERLKSVSSSDGLSATEKQEKMRSMVRGLVSDMASDGLESESLSTGKRLASDCQKIVTQFMVQGSGGDWYKRLLASPDDSGDLYAHSSNVATFAALFSMATGIGRPEQMAFAGMIHDMGMTRVPQEIRDQPYEALSLKDKQIYESHVQHSLELIRSRKMIVTDDIKTLVGQHHEAVNGSGYPKHISGMVFKPESRLFAIANYFDELVLPQPNQPTRTIPQALEVLRAHSIRKKEDQIYDADILKAILELFSPT
jgi:HD-GYP domain-containing protein (c-di-GMP phosphodiesterase class II)